MALPASLTFVAAAIRAGCAAAAPAPSAPTATPPDCEELYQELQVAMQLQVSFASKPDPAGVMPQVIQAARDAQSRFNRECGPR